MRRLGPMLLLVALVACEQDPGRVDPCANPPTITNPTGLPHGYACQENNECIYGRCLLNPLVTGGSFGICTKDCSGCPGSECAADDIASEGLIFTCIRPSGYPATCVPSCSSVALCQAIDTRYTTCSNVPTDYRYGSIGVRSFCMVE